MKENLIDNHWSEFLTNPLNVVERLYNQMNCDISVKEFHNLIQEQLRTLLKSDSNRMQQMPYLNNRNLQYDSIKNKSLVRYRCMVQDMFNPEIYAAILKSQNGIKINLYTDSVLFDEKYFVDPNKNYIADRNIYYVISVPGVNEWIRVRWDKEGRIENMNQLSSSDQMESKPSISLEESVKRPLDEEMSSSKKQKANNQEKENNNSTEAQVSNKRHNYCTPIKSEETINRPVIVKVYDADDVNLKLNDLIEVIGVIEFPNPEELHSKRKQSVDQKADSETKEPEISSMLNNLDLDHEDYVYCELPRIHALFIEPVQNLSQSIEQSNKITNNDTARPLYAKFISLLEKMMLGDNLTAQYLLCWLVSRVYKVQDSLPIGNFPINISNLDKISNDQHSTFINKFYEVLQHLCTHSLCLHITINELNNRILNPFKEKDNTKLQSGLLQLPSNFSLILDETSLQPGTLKEMGLKNLSTLKELISWQSIEYDHLFYTQKINSDINVLVFSEGKSLFEVNCEVKLEPQPDTDVEAVFDLINACLTENFKDELRDYLIHVRTSNCEIPVELQKRIQDDFVQMRKDSSSERGPKICSDDLHQFLALSRLLAISECSSTLNDHHWQKAKSMELERRKRIQISSNKSV